MSTQTERTPAKATCWLCEKEVADLVPHIRDECPVAQRNRKHKEIAARVRERETGGNEWFRHAQENGAVEWQPSDESEDSKMAWVIAAFIIGLLLFIWIFNPS